MQQHQIVRMKNSLRYVLTLMGVIAFIFSTGGTSVIAQGPEPANPSQKELLVQCTGNVESESTFQNGVLTFVGTAAGEPILQTGQLKASLSPELAARSYLSNCGSLFGVQNQAAELSLMESREIEDGRTVLRFQQLYQGLPVFASELVMQLDGSNNVILVNSGITVDVKASLEPTVAPLAARETALEAVANEQGRGADSLSASKPELWLYNPASILPEGSLTSLVWRTEVTSKDLAPIRYLILVDAYSGAIDFSINQVDTARNRLTYTANNTLTRPGTLVCNEANPNCTGGDTDAKNAHIYGGHTYDFYFNYHNRDSLDNAGMTLISTVHYDVGYCNAFWDGAQMTYGDGCFIVTDDVVGHEMTHGVTEHTSNLVYAYQSGAINESFSDVWGEFVDLTNGAGNDTAGVRWYMGEEVSGGAIRYMKDPTVFGDPDKMTSPYYYNGTGDNGGVHINSGVNNKAAYLMTDGDTFNGYTVTGIGITKVAKVYYEAQTNILTSSSQYMDLYNALYQACNNLVGTSGITAADCTQVRNATLATEMNYVPAPPANDDFDSATIIPGLDYTNSILTTGATSAGDDPILDCAYGGPAQKFNTVWYRYTPGTAQNVTFDTLASNYDTTLGVWTGTRGSLAPVGCNDDFGGTLQSSVTVSLSAGTTYYIEAASWSSGGGALVLKGTVSIPTTWTIKSPMTVARSRPAAAVVKGKVYVIGGESPLFSAEVQEASGNSAFSEDWTAQAWETTLEQYNPVTNTWATKAQKPTGVSNVSAAVIKNKIYVPGGYDGSTALSILEVYTPSTNTWSSKAPLPAARMGPAVAAVYDKLYVIGGYDGANYTNTCFVYNPSSNAWSSCAPMSFARGYTAAGVVNGKIYVVGGRDGSVLDMNYVEAYDPLTNTWTTKAPLMTPRGGPGVVGYGKFLYACGGGWSSYLTSCEKYDPTTNTWTAFPGLNVGRRTLALVAADGRLYAEGGYSGGYSAVNEQSESVPGEDSVYSTGTQDGWILESSENSSVGGSINSAATTFVLGDDAAKKQYRSVLSFNTSTLPDNAVVTAVTLKFKYSGVAPAGTNPISLLQGIMVDLRTGFFGTSASLAAADFQAAASKTVGPFSPAKSGSWYTITLNSATYPYINKLATNGGLTQIRLRFKLDDNNNTIANTLSLLSGNTSVMADRPQLIISYTVP